MSNNERKPSNIVGKDWKEVKRYFKERLLEHDLILRKISVPRIESDGRYFYPDYNFCAYCGGYAMEKALKEGVVLENNMFFLTRDHVIPLNVGGEDKLGNIIPACYICNQDKSSYNLTSWYPSYDFFSAKRLEIIIDYLNLQRKTTSYNVLDYLIASNVRCRLEAYKDEEDAIEDAYIEKYGHLFQLK